MEKKKKKQTAQRNPNTPSQQKTKMNFGTSGLQISEDEASHLVGRIVEKGISDEPPTKPYLPPNPTVLPFPVARHRSHGPHWAPVGRKASAGCGDDRDEDGGLSDEDDRAFMDVDPIAPFANPVERRKKKGVDFSNWRELVAGEKSAMAEKLEGNVIRSSAKTEKREKDRQPIEAVSESEDSEASSLAKMELDYSNKDHLLEILKKRETNYSASTVVSPGTDSGHKQETMSLESEIDTENRVRLQGMSAEEIAEAQAEIMEKMDPALLRLLKKRGQEKLGKQKSLSSDVIANAEGDNGRNENVKDVKDLSVSESKVTHTETKMTSKEIKSGLDNGEARNPSPATGSLWSTWSERVEGVRGLRFSLDGTIVENDLVQAADTECVAERDFLRTEGDPGAAGYTIKEAVALTRSVIPGQRALALHILLAVLDKAVDNIFQGQVGCSIGNDDKDNKFTDWEAIWAYALGPEPELVLSLRKLLSRISVLPLYSRPEIDVGFLRGGFWKYNAKSSNVLTLNNDIVNDETEGKNTIQDDIVVAGQDFAGGLVRMGILPWLCYLLETLQRLWNNA